MFLTNGIAFVCLRFFVPLKNFSLIWRRHHYRWRAAYFNLYPALKAIDQWGHTNCAMGHPFIMVISEDPWHSHPLPCVKKWSCHYLFNVFDHRGQYSNTQLSACEANVLTDCSTAARHIAFDLRTKDMRTFSLN